MKKRILVIIVVVVLLVGVTLWIVLANYGPDPGSGELITITLQAPARAIFFYEPRKQSLPYGEMQRFWKEWPMVLPGQSIQIEVPMRYSYENRRQRINYGLLAFGFYVLNPPHEYATSVNGVRLGVPRYAGCGFLMFKDTDSGHIVTAVIGNP